MSTKRLHITRDVIAARREASGRKSFLEAGYNDDLRVKSTLHARAHIYSRTQNAVLFYFYSLYAAAKITPRFRSTAYSGWYFQSETSSHSPGTPNALPPRSLPVRRDGPFSKTSRSRCNPAESPPVSPPRSAVSPLPRTPSSPISRACAR